jgi:hypothetical protein
MSHNVEYAALLHVSCNCSVAIEKKNHTLVLQVFCISKDQCLNISYLNKVMEHHQRKEVSFI